MIRTLLVDERIISYDRSGSGPALVLVHGGFSDHHTNWEFIISDLQRHYTVYALARRGRGETTPTEGHSVEDECRDVVALIEHIGEPVYLLGHSYGALLSLFAAPLAAGSIRKLILYEPPLPQVISPDALEALETRAAAGDWDGLAHWFFSRVLFVPDADLDALRASDLWPPIVSDSKASLNDLRAVYNYRFQPERFRDLRMPVLLQIGTESPRGLYLTDTLERILPDVRIGELQGQAHEGMTTAPEQYSQSVVNFLKQ